MLLWLHRCGDASMLVPDMLNKNMTLRYEIGLPGHPLGGILDSCLQGEVNVNKFHTERHRGLWVEYRLKRDSFPGAVFTIPVPAAHTYLLAEKTYRWHGQAVWLDKRKHMNAMYHVLLHLGKRHPDTLRRAQVQVDVGLAPSLDVCTSTRKKRNCLSAVHRSTAVIAS